MKTSLMKKMRANFRLQLLVLVAMFPSLVMMPSVAHANPSGGVVANGAAEILSDVNNPAFLQIIQNSPKAIINWQNFSISAGETTQFIQPNQMAAVLNRVVSGNPSVIAGMLSANGKVIVVNQNGIIVTSSGVVDAAGGVVLSTLDIADGDFMNGMDDSFLGTTAAGVTNYGTIMSAGGDVILLGNFIDNAGIIGAPDGVVALGAGGNIVVHAQGENKISIMAPGVGAQTGINNSGSITGAAAELKAHGNVYALAINNSGMIRATGTQTINGRVMLTSRSADGTTGGNIENTGEIKANNVDGSGGFIMIDGGPGSNVGILDGVVSTNGIGNTNGGDVVMIGQVINVAQGAEVTANGVNGGTILIGSAEDTQAVTIGGTVSANGSTGNGGSVMVLGDPSSVLSVTNTGRITATGGQNGGLVSMQGGTINAALGSVIDVGGAVNGGSVVILGEDANGAVNLNGTINAAGVTGAGGVITATGAGDVNVGSNAVMNADGATGGLVSIDAAADTRMAGTITALGNVGNGGTANVTGRNVVVAVQSSMDVSGLTGGGQINVGGGFQGINENLRNSELTIVGGLATLRADAINTGNAGTIVVWSDGDTLFGGEIIARALGEVGRGGFVEVSGKRNLKVTGEFAVSSLSGDRGMVLFDPGDITVGDTGADLLISTLNGLLRSNTDVIIATDNSDGGTGDIIFESVVQDNSNTAVLWNTSASLGIFASGDVRFFNSVQTAGDGSINIIAGWTGSEGDAILGARDAGVDGVLGNSDDYWTGGNPEDAWNFYVNGANGGVAGRFGGGPGGNFGNVYINDAANNRAVDVGSRYGNTNVAANNVILIGSSAGSNYRAQLGFRDKGTVFYVGDGENRFGTDFGIAKYGAGALMFDTNGDAIFLADGITQATYGTGNPQLGITGTVLTNPLFYAGGEAVLDVNGDVVLDGSGVAATYVAGAPTLAIIGEATGGFYVGGEAVLDANGNAVLDGGGVAATYAAGDPIFDNYGNVNPAVYAGGEQVVDSAGVAVQDEAGNTFTYAAGTPMMTIYGDEIAVAHAAHDGDPLIGLVGVNEVTVNGQVGVRLFDSTGVRATTFLAYEDSMGSEYYSNWWWRSLDGTAGGSSGIGNNLPEMGAGVSQDLTDKGGAFGNAIAGADINIEARGALIMRAADARTGSYAKIGHGAYVIGTWDRSWQRRDDLPGAGAGGVNDGEGIVTGGTNPPPNGTSLTPGDGFDRRFAFNWATRENRTTQSIARLAEVYGDINIRTGLVEDTATNTLEATSASGVVLLQAGQSASG
ncbi:MAG: filamentous hemagglutinin N-terminal domain-containing protein, partial [Verrucomicrobiales bacterium]|nr:filamentous hemagglutinin N-terminal domain-containing protein [Verrucomicrobiales bacterium]